MKGLQLGVLTVLTATAFAGLTGSVAASERPRVVVELFTSQGCSSCPPANANLVRIANEPGVLALSFSVTYWDYLGWKDLFGKQEFTDRQVVYEPALGKRGPFTPQMVFNGATTAIGYDLSEVKSFVANAAALTGPKISLKEGVVVIDGQPRTNKVYDVWMVHYDPGLREVPIGRGENQGATLTQTHVVHGLTRLGSWDGRSMRYETKPGATGHKIAVLLQEMNGGPILAAITN